MGTRASVNIKMHDGRIFQTKVNWDGYLSHTGKVLLNYFKDVESVLDMIHGGEIRFFKILEDKTIDVEYYEDDDYFPIETTDWNDEYYSYIFDSIENKWFAQFRDYDSKEDIENEIYMELGEALKLYGKEH